MNKLFGTGPKGNVLACILEPANLVKLKNGEPIVIDLNDGPWKGGLPAKVEVVIAYSETPIADAKRFSETIPAMAFEDRRTAVSEKLQPHCPECKSTIEQLGVWRSNEAPLWLTFCSACGCVFGASKPVESLRKGAPQ